MHMCRNRPRAKSGSGQIFIPSEFTLNSYKASQMGFCKSFIIAMKFLSALDFSLLLMHHSVFTFLSLNLLICKMGVIMAPTAKDGFEDYTKKYT